MNDNTKLLIALCSRPGQVSVEQLRDMVLSKIDWTAFLSDALWHKVAFIAYERLAKTELLDEALAHGSLPLLMLNHWKQLYKVNLLRNQLYLQQLELISANLVDHEVDYAVAKGGPLLIGRVYTASERKMYDLDFIARRGQLQKVIAAFAQAGFQLGNYNHSKEVIIPLAPGALRKWLLHARGLPNFLKLLPNREVVDLVVAQVQFKIGSTADGSAIGAEALLERSSARSGISSIDDIDLLLQLVLHLARETKDPEFAEWRMDWNLVKLCDLDRFLHALDENVIIEKFLPRAEALGFTAQTFQSLTVIDEIFPSPFTKRVLAALIQSNPGLHDQLLSSGNSSIYDQVAGMTARETDASSWTKLIGGKTS